MKLKQVKIDDVILGNNVCIIEPVNLYGCNVGDNCFIGPFVEIQKNTKIADNTRIQSHSFICEKVEIGKNCFVGHGVMFTNDDLKKGKISRNPSSFKKTKIGNNRRVSENNSYPPYQ